MTFRWMRRWFEAQKPEPPKPVEPVEPPPRKWVGRYMSEVEIIEDLVAKIKNNDDAIKVWSSPDAFVMPKFDPKSLDVPDATAGALMFAGMSIRNWYGLWDTDNPYTKTANKLCDMEITDGIITDPLHPDNFSGRIIDRVRKVITCAADIRADTTLCMKCGMAWWGYEQIPECNGLGIPIADRLDRWAGFKPGQRVEPMLGWVDLLNTVLRDARDALRKEGQKP